MRLKTRIVLAGGCVILLALSIPAFSRPSPRGLEADHHAQPGHAVPKKKSAQHAPKPNNKRRIAGRPQEHSERLPAAERPQPVAAVSKPTFGWPALVSEARKYLGTNPTDRKRLWCATFMNLVLAKVGYAGTNSDAAKSFAYYGRRIAEPKVGAIAVLTRGKRGGHVGVVSGIDAQGNPIIISGNHNKFVGEGVYSRARVIAYLMPTDRRPVATQVAGRGAPNRSPSEVGIDSPIAELLAAIEKEQSRAEARAEPARPSAPPERQVPHRAVQQMPEQPPQSAQPARRTLPLDPALAELLGIKDCPQSTPPPHPTAQRQQRVQPHQPGRVAAVETGLAGVRR